MNGATPFARTFFHGTKADLEVGDLILPGHNSNYREGTPSKYIFLSATLDAAVWGAELTAGNGKERIYLVEPTGDIEDDPDLTDRKYPGGPTLSYRSLQPFRVVGEVTSWAGHDQQQLALMKENLRQLKDKGIGPLND